MGEAFTIYEQHKHWINSTDKFISTKFRKENSRTNNGIDKLADNIKVLEEKLEKEEDTLVIALIKSRL